MSVVETPSKVAASALSTMDLNTASATSKDSAATLLEKMKAAASVGADKLAAAKALVVAEVTPAQAEDDIEEYRKRFVGDLDCEEKDEPLLQETTSRFVLFPIKYREVSKFSSPPLPLFLLTRVK